MSIDKDGWPALPDCSLRDYIAIEAMNGWLSSWPAGSRSENGLAKVAEASYEMADEMLAYRAKAGGDA